MFTCCHKDNVSSWDMVDRMAASTQHLLLPLLLFLLSETFILFSFSSDVFKIFSHSDASAVEERKKEQWKNIIDIIEDQQKG